MEGHGNFANALFSKYHKVIEIDLTVAYLGFKWGIEGTGRSRSLMRRKNRMDGKRKMTA